MARNMMQGAFGTLVEGGERMVSGYIFDLLLNDNTVKKMGVYKNEIDKRWDVIDVDTGLSVCHSITRKDAIARVESEPMVEKITKLVATKKYSKLKARIEKLSGPVIEVIASPERGGKLVKVKDETKPKAPKAPAKSAKPKAPKPPKKEVEQATVISLATM